MDHSRVSKEFIRNRKRIVVKLRKRPFNRHFKLNMTKKNKQQKT